MKFYRYATSSSPNWFSKAKSVKYFPYHHFAGCRVPLFIRSSNSTNHNNAVRIFCQHTLHYIFAGIVSLHRTARKLFKFEMYVDSTSYSSYHFQNKSASLSMGDKCKKWTTLNSVFQLQCIALINWFFNVHTYTWYSWQCRKITQLHTHSAVAYVVKTSLLGL